VASSTPAPTNTTAPTNTPPPTNTPVAFDPSDEDPELAIAGFVTLGQQVSCTTPVPTPPPPATATAQPPTPTPPATSTPTPLPTATPTVTPSPTLSPTPQPDIVILKTAEPQLVPVGGQVMFTLTVRNSGMVDLVLLEVSDIVPDGMTYVPNSASNGGTYSAAGNSVDWSLSGLSVGASEQLSYVATLDDASKPITNTACVAAQNAAGAQVTDCSDVPVNPSPTSTPNPPAPSVPTSTLTPSPAASRGPTSAGTSTPTGTPTPTATSTPTVTSTPTPTLEPQVVEARQVILGILFTRLQLRVNQPTPPDLVPPVQLPPDRAQGPF
jgi:uncharacterized repeat protein (TIGR01451 family)